MDTIIFVAVPVFLLCIVLEVGLTRQRGIGAYEKRDTWASLAMGVGAAVVGLPFRIFFLWVLTLVYEYRLFTLEWGVLTYLGLFLAEDLAYYWSHRMNHEVRILWAGHVNHHSSQHYHLATALRQSWTQPYMMWIWWLPLPLFGFRPEWILFQQAVSLIYQFFIHTEQVHKLGPLEWVFNTPSHHRVHHAVNTRYLDRNHAGILIVWDRLFGTFVEESEDDPPVYGITRNIATLDHSRAHDCFTRIPRERHW